MLSNVKVGDLIWTIMEGWVKVEITSNNLYPVKTITPRQRQYTPRQRQYTLSGKYYASDKYPSAFLEPPEGFNAEPKPCVFKKGDRVLAGPEKHRRYFSHMEDGYFVCFRDGRNEWASNGRTFQWKICVPYIEDNQK